MNKVEKLVQFWGVLAYLIKGEELTDDQAKVIIDLRAEVDCEIPVSTDDFTPAYINILHRAYHSDQFDGFDDLVDLVEAGFHDLARYLRIPRARTVFAQLRELIDIEGRDLFVHLINVKRLDNDPNGCAVVTMVVNDHEKLQSLLQGKSTAECIHYSDATTTTTEET